MTTRVRSTIEGVHFAERTVLSVTLGVFCFFENWKRGVPKVKVVRYSLFFL